MTTPEATPETPTYANPAFRVQGMHVSAFALAAANRPRNAMLACSIGALLCVVAIVGGIRMMKIKGNGPAGLEIPAVLLVGIAMTGYRQLTRSRALLTVAQAAQKDPLAVWGVQNAWLYPLGPSADRTKLRIALDAKDVRAIYTKPRAPIETPRELP